MQISILLDDTGEEVYKTGVLSPGDTVPRDKLAVALHKGVYPATAVFTALDMESGSAVGQTAAGITITVLN